MRKIISVCCLLIFIQFSSFGQTLNNTIKIKYFIKVWGFLKYYHPLVATGNTDWDSVFIAHVPNVINSKTSIQYNNELLAIIHSVDKPPKVQPLKIYDSLFLKNKTDLSWAYKSKEFGVELKKQLESIYDNRSQDTNKYIKIPYGFPDFSGEKRYDNMGYPNLKYRLLFLSRFWNIIEYFCPNKYLIGEDWNNILTRFIPKFEAANDSTSYYKALLELAKSLHDGHSQVVLDGKSTPLNNIAYGKYAMPFLCEIVNGSVVVRYITYDSLSVASNIKVGDIILNSDNQSTPEIINRKRKYVSASNLSSEIHSLSWYLLNGNTQVTKVTVKRKNKVFQTKVSRVPNEENFNQNYRYIFNHTGGPTAYKWMEDSVLMIYVAQIWQGNVDTLKKMIKPTKAILFDVRNHPQGNDAFYNIFDMFLPIPKIIDYSTHPLVNFPSLFKWHQTPKIGHQNDSIYKGKVVILVDERTQSQGEYFSMALQTIPHSVTIGSQTAGADGTLTPVPMGNGLSLSYSGYGVYYPDKTQTQRVGIRIDIPVKKTLEAVKNGKDEILERAIQYIINGK